MNGRQWDLNVAIIEKNTIPMLVVHLMLNAFRFAFLCCEKYSHNFDRVRTDHVIER